MEQLSVIVIFHLDDDQVEKCIRSAKEIAEEIILVDPAGRPKSKEMIGKYSINCLPGHDGGFIKSLEAAVKRASFDNIFFIGSNEYLSESLRTSIRKIKQNWTMDGYAVTKYKNYYGKWLRYSGIYPDQPVRFYKKGKGYWAGEPLEEHIVLKNPGSVALLKGELYCRVYKSIQEHIFYINEATETEALKSYKKGMKVNNFQIIFVPFKYFINRYFIKLGFLDGFYGLVFAVLKGFSKFLELVKLRDLIRGNTKG